MCDATCSAPCLRTGCLVDVVSSVALPPRESARERGPFSPALKELRSACRELRQIGDTLVSSMWLRVWRRRMAQHGDDEGGTSVEQPPEDPPHALADLVDMLTAAATKFRCMQHLTLYAPFSGPFLMDVALLAQAVALLRARLGSGAAALPVTRLSVLNGPSGGHALALGLLIADHMPRLARLDLHGVSGLPRGFLELLAHGCPGLAALKLSGISFERGALQAGVPHLAALTELDVEDNDRIPEDLQFKFTNFLPLALRLKRLRWVIDGPRGRNATAGSSGWELQQLHLVSGFSALTSLVVEFHVPDLAGAAAAGGRAQPEQLRQRHGADLLWGLRALPPGLAHLHLSAKHVPFGDAALDALRRLDRLQELALLADLCLTHPLDAPEPAPTLRAGQPPAAGSEGSSGLRPAAAAAAALPGVTSLTICAGSSVRAEQLSLMMAQAPQVTTPQGVVALDVTRRNSRGGLPVLLASLSELSRRLAALPQPPERGFLVALHNQGNRLHALPLLKALFGEWPMLSGPRLYGSVRLHGLYFDAEAVRYLCQLCQGSGARPSCPAPGDPPSFCGIQLIDCTLHLDVFAAASDALVVGGLRQVDWLDLQCCTCVGLPGGTKRSKPGRIVNTRVRAA